MNNKIFGICICIILGLGVYNVMGINTEYYTENMINEFDEIEVIDQQQSSDCGYGCPFFNNIWIAQGFTPTLERLTRIELKIFKTGNPTNILTFSIRSSLTGSDLTSITLEGVNIPPYSLWVEFDFPDLSVGAGEQYYMLIRTPGGSFFDYYCCLFDINNPYEGGDVWGSLNSGNSWSPIDDPDYPDPDGCFITYGLDETPSVPKIEGPSSGNINIEYTYTISASDPENHDVYYYVDWGDDTNSGWLGPYHSDLEVTFIHTWDKKGNYLIKAKAKDVYDAEGEWANLEVSMPKENIHYFLLYKIKYFFKQLINNFHFINI